MGVGPVKEITVTLESGVRHANAVSPGQQNQLPISIHAIACLRRTVFVKSRDLRAIGCAAAAAPVAQPCCQALSFHAGAALIVARAAHGFGTRKINVVCVIGLRAVSPFGAEVEKTPIGGGG